MKLISNMIEAHIFRESNGKLEFLLLKRSEAEYYPNIWQMVSGKIRENEKAFETALREIREETGLIPEKMWVAPNINSFYNPEEEYISFLPVFAAKVKNNSIVQLSKEHAEYKWVNVDQAVEMLAWIGQHKSVKVIDDYFRNRKYHLQFVEINY